MEGNGGKMTTAALAIVKIEQMDNQHFDVLWSDGIRMRYNLSHLQHKCPCVYCTENTPPFRDTSTKGIRNVGSYALRIDFTQGCTNGIYTYDYLRSLGGKIDE